MSNCKHECFRIQSAAQVESLLAQSPPDEAPRRDNLIRLLAKLTAAPCSLYCDNAGTNCSTRITKD